jgi:hypothetical protein
MPAAASLVASVERAPVTVKEPVLSSPWYPRQKGMRGNLSVQARLGSAISTTFKEPSVSTDPWTMSPMLDATMSAPIVVGILAHRSAVAADGEHRWSTSPRPTGWRHQAQVALGQHFTGQRTVVRVHDKILRLHGHDCGDQIGDHRLGVKFDP